jgi:chaperone LolA
MRSILEATRLGLLTAALWLILATSAYAGEHSTDAAVGLVPCDDARARSVVEIVQDRYDAMNGLAADFEQSTESVVLSMGDVGSGDEAPATSRGHVVFSKPGRMRWEYQEPLESYVISDGRTLWIHDVAAKQATRVPVGEEYLTGAALQFLLGEGKLSDTFAIAVGACSETGIDLDLRPRGPASYERLTMTADAQSGLISETSIVDLFGNRTRIRFRNIVVDPAPSAGAFRFDPPAGVEIVDLSGPK